MRLSFRSFGTDVQRKYECYCIVIIDKTILFSSVPLTFFNFFFFITEVVLDLTANFSGNSYLQLDNGLLDKSKKEHSILMTFTTDSDNGLLYWQGQEPNNDGVVENYIAISSMK